MLNSSHQLKYKLKDLLYTQYPTTNIIINNLIKMLQLVTNLILKYKSHL